MKLLIVGDLHLRTRTPARRTEPDFSAVCLNKLKQIIDLADQDDSIVVQVGDFFDSADPSKALVAAVIEALNHGRYLDDSPPCWLAIHGQHDLQYHSDAARQRSALRVLSAAQSVSLLDLESDRCSGDVCFYGASFGQTPLRPTTVGFNVLVAHAMVGDKPLWPGQDLTGPEDYVKKHPGYDLYCLGDYHYPYSIRVGDAWVINAGCVLRLTADERDRTRRPKVVRFDTSTRTPKDEYLAVTPEALAFDLDGYERDQQAQQAKESFAAMADVMKGKGLLGVNFKDNLVEAFDRLSTPESVRQKVWDCWQNL